MRALLKSLGDIWRLAIPYFTTRDIGEARFWPIRFKAQERWIALSLLIAVIGIELGSVGIDVRLSYFSRDLYDALQNKDGPEFWSQLLFVFCPWAAVGISSAVLQLVMRAYLTIRWRRWMTERTISNWLDGSAHYRMQLTGSSTDNPDQRIADDINQFTTTTFTLGLGLLSKFTSLVSFSVILWTLSAGFTVPGTELVVPGFLFWVALLYAVLVTWLTHLIGRPLIRLYFQQQRYEADFRFSLARLREYGEQVALLRGEQAEHVNLSGRFRALIGNFLQIVDCRKLVVAFTQSYAQANAVLPFILLAPYYFSGKVTLGIMMQTVGAFSNVQSSLSFFIDSYASIAEFKSVIDRLTSFAASAQKARALSTVKPHIEVGQGGQDLGMQGLEVALPQGKTVVRIKDTTLRHGESVLVNGPSGAGKSTLFRAISGIWPFGDGAIRVPANAKVMLLPQRPYVPIGTLRAALTYPAAADAFPDAMVRATLDDVRLSQFADRLDEEAHWGQTMSLGEQQRLALGRALLAKPDWLFLDEATSALDEPLEQAMYHLLPQKLPGVTLISIGHRHTLQAFHQRHIELKPAADGVSEPVDVQAVTLVAV
ncbi:putative ATP-binding cassette transporter [Rhizobiales bacterium GAS113]|nr:putative ATP-binding cassette transporter [Rhizobiales bacterium GAS113]SED38285.1 putative ATP-binding cassette transporter [Rhizobiales bacterium GAS188]